MKYYRIKIGYRNTEFISIDETELETAIYAFTTDSKGMFKSGVVRGKDIIAITPDYHKALGLKNENWEFEEEDWEEVSRLGLKKSLIETYESTSKKVKYLISTKQEHLIGKNVNLPALENNKVSEVTKSLSDKMKV